MLAAEESKDIKISNKNLGQSHVKSKGEAKFVGEDRIQLVDDIELIYDSVKKNKKPHWISIEANSGWGKTRLIQEFYKRLAAKQAKGNKYWPSSILEGNQSDNNNIPYKRKLIFPKIFNRSLGAYPEFLWWGIACSQRNGSPSLSLVEDFKEVIRHAPGLAKVQKIKWHKEGAKKGGVNATKETSLEVSNTMLGDFCKNYLSNEFDKELVEAVFGVTGVGLITGLGIKASKHINRKLEHSIISSSGGDLPSADNEDILDEMVNSLRKISLNGLPVVIYIEDFHTAPSLLHKLLKKLLQCDTPILIITSEWPTESEGQSHVHNLIKGAPLINQRTVVKQGERINSSISNIKTESIHDRLSSIALQNIIFSHYPLTSQKVKSNLANEKYKSPLEIELLCTLPKCIDNFFELDLQLTEEEIEELPTSISGFYLDMWNELPIQSKQFLALATLLLSEKIKKFPSDFISVCIKNSPYIKTDFSEANLPKSWLKKDINGHYSFVDEEHIKIAKVSLNQLFFKRNTDGFIDTVKYELTRVDLSTNEKDALFYAELIIQYYENRTIINDVLVLKAIFTIQKHLTKFPKEIKRQIKLGEYLKHLNVKDHNELLIAKESFLGSLVVTGDVKRAISGYEILLEEYPQPLRGVKEKSLLDVKHSYGSALWNDGQAEKAFQVFSEIYPEFCNVYGEHSEDTLLLAKNIIVVNPKTTVNINIAETDALLETVNVKLGGASKLSLSLKSHLARLLTANHEEYRARSIYESLYFEQKSTLGEFDSDTVCTHKMILKFYSSDVPTDKLDQRFNYLLNGVGEYHGKNSPIYLDCLADYLTTLSFSRKDGIEAEDAILKFKELITSCSNSLDDNHFLIHYCQDNLATLLAQIEKYSEAINYGECLYESRHRELGIKDKSTITMLSFIANLYGLVKNKSKELEARETLLKAGNILCDGGVDNKKRILELLTVIKNRQNDYKEKQKKSRRKSLKAKPVRKVN